VTKTTNRAAIIRLDGERCGLLEDVAGGGSRFTYDEAWLQRTRAQPVSLTMPLRSEPYVSDHLLPFFRNLLPEGWLLDISVTRLKVARDDAFGLLLATCRDCIGACEVIPEAEQS